MIASPEDTSPLLRRSRPTADAIAALFAPFVEVAVHDLASQTVVHLANAFSRRRLGDESALDDIAFDPSEAVIGPYEKVNWDGRRLRSISIVVRDDEARPIGLICVNADITALDSLRGALALFLDGAAVSPQPEKLFRDDWQERINAFLTAWLKDRGATLGGLGRNEKREIVEALYRQGAFKGRSAAPYVASVLSLSRATVFAYLKAMKALKAT